MDIKELYKLYQAHPNITTDSRDCPEGSIFLALKGASFDGNQYAVAALEKGCAYAIVDDQQVYEDYKASNPVVQDCRLIFVDDCLQTFKDLAREHRRQFDIPIIGITGTNGKTTTKELIAAVLSEKYNVLYTQGNFNNDVGVPKTLFRLNEMHEMAVIEMGASHPGDIKTLVETVEPTCGLITNVGKAHLQGFGSFEGVKQTKGELYDFLVQQNDNRQVFINEDNEHLREMAEERGIKQLYRYGTHTQGVDLQVWGEVVSCAPLLKFRWGTTAKHLTPNSIQTHLIGAYNIDNMLAAIAVGQYFGVADDKICHALENYIPTNNRSQLEETPHNHLIVDAYNANPTSMAAALENFKVMEVEPKMAILGKMGELGDTWKEEHEKVIRFLSDAQFDKVWLVGDEYFQIPCPFSRFKNVEEVKQEISRHQPQGYYILIKGSNSNKLFQLPELL